jgi:hypothetical protein
MMRLILLPLILIVATTADAAKAVTRTSMPAAFQGDWALKTRECELGPSDSGNMRITARKLIQFESVGKVLRVVVLDPQTVRVESRITHGGGTYGSTETMNISEDKNTLIVRPNGDPDIYKRCPK